MRFFTMENESTVWNIHFELFYKCACNSLLSCPYTTRRKVNFGAHCWISSNTHSKFWYTIHNKVEVHGYSSHLEDLAAYVKVLVRETKTLADSFPTELLSLQKMTTAVSAGVNPSSVGRATEYFYSGVQCANTRD